MDTIQRQVNIGQKKMAQKFDLVLAIDFETTGLAFGSLDPTYNPATGEKFQGISVGLIVASAKTLKPIEELYVEIQYNEKYTWSDGAEKVHGLSREYLAENGMTRFEAAKQIAQFIEKYFGPIEMIRSIVLAGHNVATFDRYFLIELLTEIGIDLKVGNRHLDSFSCGNVLWNAFDSNEVFEQLDVVREQHNSLEDARLSLLALRTMRLLYKEGMKALEDQDGTD